MSLSLLFLMSLLVTDAGDQCLTPSNEFAVEVVVSDYSLNELAHVMNRYVNLFYGASQQNSELITLISETRDPNGLSIRIQEPTELVSLKQPKYRFIVNVPGLTKSTYPGYYLSWKVNCLFNNCVFSRDPNTVSVDKGREEVVVEVNQEIEACSPSCDGVCFSTGEESLCIPRKMQKDFEQVLYFTNSSKNLSDFIARSRIVAAQGPAATDIRSINGIEYSFENALREELVYLKNNRVINLSDEDLREIVALAERGHAGHNYRIVNDGERWTYYNRAEGSSLTSELDCRAFSLVEQDGVTSSTTKNLFYVIPAVLTVVAVILLVILNIIARALTSRQKSHRVEKHLKKDERSEAN